MDSSESLSTYLDRVAVHFKNSKADGDQLTERIKHLHSSAADLRKLRTTYENELKNLHKKLSDENDKHDQNMMELEQLCAVRNEQASNFEELEEITNQKVDFLNASTTKFNKKMEGEINKLNNDCQGVLTSINNRL